MASMGGMGKAFGGLKQKMGRGQPNWSFGSGQTQPDQMGRSGAYAKDRIGMPGYDSSGNVPKGTTWHFPGQTRYPAPTLAPPTPQAAGQVQSQAQAQPDLMQFLRQLMSQFGGMKF